MNERKQTTRLLLTAILLIVITAAASPTAAQEKIRVACVGDSITFGSGIQDRGENSYPAQLGRMLGEKWETRNFGVGGATLLKKGDKPYWTQKAFEQAQAFAPHVVVIKLGTNDSKPQNWKYKEEFAADYAALIAQFAALPSRPTVWLCLPVPVFQTRWGISEEVLTQEAIPILRRVAQETNTPTINLHEALSGKAELFPDKIHPNAEGAGLMAREIASAIADENGSRTDFPGKKSDWNGFQMLEFKLDGASARIVKPKETAEGMPWIWRARFFGHEPQTDLALLDKGFHVAYIDVAGLFGAPRAVARWDAFYAFLTKRLDFGPRPALEGMSRGGLIIFNLSFPLIRRTKLYRIDRP